MEVIFDTNSSIVTWYNHNLGRLTSFAGALGVVVQIFGEEQQLLLK